MAKTYKISLPQYGNDEIDFVIGKSVDDCIKSHKILSKSELPSTMGGEGMTVTMSDGKRMALAILIATDANDVERNIVHECFHATTVMIEFFSLPNSAENSEPGAYLMDSLYNECMIRYEKYLKTKKNV